jgi:hypothetical protein
VPEHLCDFCGRDAVDVVQLASEDVMLLTVCAECVDDPTADEQQELFGPAGVPRRPLATMPGRDDDAQQALPLDDSTHEKRGAA